MPQALTTTRGFQAITSVAQPNLLRVYRLALAARVGELIPLVTETFNAERFVIERHLCIDTTAAGGNASLVAVAE